MSELDKLFCNKSQELFNQAPFDQLTYGFICFKAKTFESHNINKTGVVQQYFDLASITKVLTNALCYLVSPKVFTPEMILCLNHRGGLPSWAVLPNIGWKEMIHSYPIKESPTLYSDLSALRVMLEFNESSSQKMEDICRNFWQEDIFYWLDSPYTVHDPNALWLKTFCSHAGAFASFEGLSKTILRLNEKHDLLKVMKQRMSEDTKNRFVGGWDRVEDLQNTSAGVGCSPFTFGHLGFTGTSLWIDAEKEKAFIVLSNATQHYWYAKKDLMEIRKSLGARFWESLS